MKSITAKDGIPVVTSGKDWYEECCDCALTHRVRYRAYLDGKLLKNAQVEATFWRANKETEEARKFVKLSFIRRRRTK